MISFPTELEGGIINSPNEKLQLRLKTDSVRKLDVTSSVGGLNCLTSSITVIKGQKRGANRNRDRSGSNARLTSFYSKSD